MQNRKPVHVRMKGTVHEHFFCFFFFLVTGQVNTLTKLLKNEKTPFFRNLVLLPLLVQQEADPAIQVQIASFILCFKSVNY